MQKWEAPVSSLSASQALNRRPKPQPDPIAQAIKEAASLIAEAIHANAEATVLLARATAGEFEDGDTVEAEVEKYLDGSPKA